MNCNFREDFPAAWMNLGVVLANLKQLSESESAYKKALMYRKNYADCHYNLGNLVNYYFMMYLYYIIGMHFKLILILISQVLRSKQK